MKGVVGRGKILIFLVSKEKFSNSHYDNPIYDLGLSIVIIYVEINSVYCLLN